MRMTDFADRAALVRLALLGGVALGFAAAMFALVVATAGTASAAMDGAADAARMSYADALGLMLIYALGLTGIHGTECCVVSWLVVFVVVGIIIGIAGALQIIFEKAADRVLYGRGLR